MFIKTLHRKSLLITPHPLEEEDRRARRKREDTIAGRLAVFQFPPRP